MHTYSVVPEAARQRVIVGFRAHTVEISAVGGRRLAVHRRLFGKRRAERIDQVAAMSALVNKPGAWRQSQLRDAMVDGPGKSYLDSLPKAVLRDYLRTVREQAGYHGLEQVWEALDMLAARDGRDFTPTDLAVLASRVDGFGLGRVPDAGPDLGLYDQMLGTATSKGAAA